MRENSRAAGCTSRGHSREVTSLGGGRKGTPSDEGSAPFIDAVEQVLELTLEQQGNRFAEAVRTQADVQLRHDLLTTAEDVITRNSTQLRSLKVPRNPLVDLATDVATSAFLVSGAVRGYLRELADAYALLAFMQEAPDVQRAVSQFFSQGRLVLDTSVVLPCLPESLMDVGDQRYTHLLPSVAASRRPE